MQFVNLTPHDIVLICGEKKITISRSGAELRAEELASVVDDLNVEGLNIPIKTKTYGIPYVLKNGDKITSEEFFKQFDRKSVFIVSRIAADAVKEPCPSLWSFHLFLSPSDPVRNEQGQIIGCAAFQM